MFRNTSYFFSALLVVGLVTTSSCGHKKKKNRDFIIRHTEHLEVKSTPSPEAEAFPATGESEAAAQDAQLFGQWVGSCLNTMDEGDGSYTSEQLVMVFDQQASTAEQIFYSGKDCKASELWYAQRASSTYTSGETANLGKNVKKIDAKLVKVYSTAYTDNEVAVRNDHRKPACGYTDWQKGVEVDVTNLPCNNKVKVGDGVFDIYQVTGNKVQFGLNGLNQSNESELGRSDKNRPRTLDNAVYTKRN